MNIRLDSKEVRVRVKQNEVTQLLTNGSLNEEFHLPNFNIKFKVAFADATDISQKENEVVFLLSPAARSRLTSSVQNKDPIETLNKEMSGRSIIFSLEVDLFKQRKRE